VLYAVFAGADFGGGVWDLFAIGPRAKKQRDLISHALAPVWEANHVWLILLVVVMFSAFPAAFAGMMTALHTPLSLMLVGIVLRGSAFTFRQYAGGGDRIEAAWGRVFAVASTLTPIFLGVCIGALTTGESWAGVFPICVGLFALALFAMVAGVFLTLEAKDLELENDFRRRALVAATASAVLAGATALVSKDPLEYAPIVGVSLMPGGLMLFALFTRRFRFARACAVTLVALVVAGWGYHQYPYLLRPNLTVAAAAAPEALLALLVPTLAVGALILFPSLFWLFRVFKTRETAP
jgi:cytochrome d ubiquinol oxidase subunit II